MSLYVKDRIKRIQSAVGAHPDGIVGPDTVSALEDRLEIRPPNSRKRIFIDPGHGGVDSGAVGPSGLKESNVVLAVALLVAEKLRRAGYQAKLSRGDDSFVSLSKRSEMSNAWGADRFVSIHCNSAERPSAHGMETWYKSQRGKTLASRIQNNLINAHPQHLDRGLKKGNFSVLRRTHAPAALVECEFIQNDMGEAFLRSSESHKSLAEAIFKGIDDYEL